MGAFSIPLLGGVASEGFGDDPGIEAAVGFRPFTFGGMEDFGPFPG
jgi:hypothetical protein